MTTRNLQVEGIRGVAMLLVLISHFFCRYQQIYQTNGYSCPLIITYFGTFGVAIFLAIFGYYIESSGGYCLLRKRLIRLWPSYFVAITICFILTRIWELPGRTVTFSDYLFNIPFINGFIGVPYVDGAHWYLTTTIACLLCFSIIQLRVQNLRKVLYIAWMFMLAVVWALQIVFQGVISKGFALIYSLIGGEYVPVVMMGTVFSLANKKEKRYIFLLGAITVCDGIVMLGLQKFIVSFIAVLMVCLAVKNKMNLLEAKCFTFLGKTSYSIYLIHQNIGFLLIYYISRHIGGYSIWVSVFASFLMITFGILFYYIIEHPFQKYLKLFKLRSNDGV